MEKNKEYFERQIKGLMLILKQEEGMVTRTYVLEKLGMILSDGIGFHPSISEKLDD